MPYEVRADWIVALVADTFHMSPLQAARELDEDTDGRILWSLTLLRYAEAKGAVESAVRECARAKSTDAMDALTQSNPRLIRKVLEVKAMINKEDMAR